MLSYQWQGVSLIRIPHKVIFDVDGVLTDGSFYSSIEGKLLKKFGPHDHDGIKMIAPFFDILFVTADKRGFEISRKRIVSEMNQKLLLINEKNRLKILAQDHSLDRSAYMGDGFYDAPILQYAQLGIAPSNARIEAQRAADYVTPSMGGNGAVLDACLYLLERYYPIKLAEILESECV